jgi:hypothetical protein
MSLRRTPVARPDGAELVRRIAQETADLPPTTRELASREPARAHAPPSATEQINFRGSPEMARLLARLAAEQGSIRLVIARLLTEAGHGLPEVDLAPPPGRRRLQPPAA